MKLISKAFRMACVKGIIQFYKPPTGLSKNGMSHPGFDPTRSALPPVLISRPGEGRRLSWTGWLVKYRGGMPDRRKDDHPSQYQPTDSAAAGDLGIELTTID